MEIQHIAGFEGAFAESALNSFRLSSEMEATPVRAQHSGILGRHGHGDSYSRP